MDQEYVNPTRFLSSCCTFRSKQKWLEKACNRVAKRTTMTQNSPNFDFFDPTGMGKQFRDASLDAYAKMMVELVNTEAYAEASGAMLDAWLSSSAPFRQVMEHVMTQTLAQLKLASRDEIHSVAQRLTNVELRLDDLDAKLDMLLRAIQSIASTATAKSSHTE